MAYLHATPRAGNGMTRGRSRLAQLREDGAVVPMPPVPDEARALLAHFLEVGPATQGGMGLAPLSFAELESWQRVVGLRLLPWEAQLLRRLSIEYVAQRSESEAPNAEAPWGSSIARDREDVSRRVRLIFGARARGSKGGKQ